MLSKIYDSEYVCDLSILQHAHEIVNLQKAHEEAKALKDKDRADRLRAGLTNEKADMLIVLNKWEGFQEKDLITNRLLKFKEKAQENNE